MDAVSDIKSRLPIEDLVGRYCQLQKKGRSFVALCPFHKDSHPSLLVSPDKGIAYCFACQTGGDIFNFYKAIEGVEFPQALKELAEMTGVTLPDRPVAAGPKKEEKDVLRECLQSALEFFRSQFTTSALAQDYLKSRGVPKEQIEIFQLGYAPDSYSATYDHLLKKGFSRTEILGAGLGIQRELNEERIYDRFRNRLIFPIHDAQGLIVGFGGRTLGNDDAKYINSSDGPLYHKSSVLFGLQLAREEIRNRKQVILVEGYFDVLACHRVGITHVVATSGTALTEQHAKILKRYVESVSLCLDQDPAGLDAAERAFFLLSKEGLPVQTIELPQKDPGDLVQSDPVLLKDRLESGGNHYLDAVLKRIGGSVLSSPVLKRQALLRVLSLLEALPLAVERNEYLIKASAAFGTTETALKEDLTSLHAKDAARSRTAAPAENFTSAFSKTEIALCLFLLYPSLHSLLSELIEPEEGMAAALYRALKNIPDGPKLAIDTLDLPDEYRERASILALFGEHHGFGDWSESLAAREIKKNCHAANRDFILQKQQEIMKKLSIAKSQGKRDEEALLTNQYQEVLKLAKMAV